MRLFSTLYNKVICWSKHRHAPIYLTGISFIESSFFPIPPDIMLITMGLAKPKRAWFYAGLATLGSVLGGIAGYLLGAFFFNLMQPLLLEFNYWPAFLQVQQWFHTWGFWVVFLAGFSPIPYKLFTIGAGAIHMAFIPFFIASIVGRAMRFFLVSAIMFWGGESMQRFLHRYIDIIGYAFIAILLIAYLIWYIMH